MPSIDHRSARIGRSVSRYSIRGNAITTLPGVSLSAGRNNAFLSFRMDAPAHEVVRISAVPQMTGKETKAALKKLVITALSQQIDELGDKEAKEILTQSANAQYSTLMIDTLVLPSERTGRLINKRGRSNIKLSVRVTAVGESVV